MRQSLCIISAILIIFTSSCNELLNHVIEGVNCNNLQTGIIEMNSAEVSDEVNKLTKDLKAQISDHDAFGHKQNLNKLIERLNNVCSEISASLICYACIETYPPQSEILVTTDSSGTLIYRTLDINTPKDDILTCIRVHKYYSKQNSSVHGATVE